MEAVSALEAVLDPRISLPVGAGLWFHLLRSIRACRFVENSAIPDTAMLLMRRAPRATPTGLEPVTSAVTGRRDNHLRQGATR